MQSRSSGVDSDEDNRTSSGPIHQRKKHILFIAETWDVTDDDGLSIVSKKISERFANNKDLKVSCLVSETSSELEMQAKRSGVHLYSAKAYKGWNRRECLGNLPENVGIVDAIVTCGTFIGKFGQPLKDKCRDSRAKWVHIACSHIPQDDEKHELEYCKDANIVLAVDHAVGDEVTSRLPDKAKFLLTPGVLGEFVDCKQRSEDLEIFRVVVFCPPAAEIQAAPDAYSIAVKAISGSQASREYRLISICAPGDEIKDVNNALRNAVMLTSSRHHVRRYIRSVEGLKELFCEADLLILPFLPSESDSFGLVALKAVSSGLPILVTPESGIGRALLAKVPFGNSLIVDSDEPSVWLEAIRKQKDKRRDQRLEEAAALRRSWGKQFPWEQQCTEGLGRVLEVSSRQACV